MSTGDPLRRESTASADLPLAVQLARYLLVGGVAFAADFAALAVLTELLHVHYLWSALAAFMLGLIVNYFLSVKWVFNVRTLENTRLEFLLFALVGVVGLGLNELVLWISTQSLHVFYLHSKILATAIVLGWNFSARKLLLFSTPGSRLKKEDRHLAAAQFCQAQPSFAQSQSPFSSGN